MSVEADLVAATIPPSIDVPHEPPSRRTRLYTWVTFLALAAGFVLIGGGNLDLGPTESRIGLAASAEFGPLGQVYGGWEPSLWPATVAPSLAWAHGEEGEFPTAASVRWPAAIAGILIGLVLHCRVFARFGFRAAILLSFCWFGSVALIDRSAGGSLNLVAGLGVVAALDRLLGRGSDWIAGSWAALAFAAGGWPPLALIALTTIVIGRRESKLGAGLLVPPLVIALAWSSWALTVLPAEAWAAALTLPFTQTSAWLLVLEVLALGLPWSPFALLSISRSVREGWSPSERSLVLGWLQVAGAALITGTFVPGLAGAARIPALAGLAVAAAACLDRLWTLEISVAARRGFLTLAVTIATVWILLASVAGISLASAAPYYRYVAIIVVSVALTMGAIAAMAIVKGDIRRGLITMALLAFSLKLGHWGYYVPEWNYRRSQGPWGRAIGQWVPPRWPIYTTHTWPHDLAFATGRHVRQLAHPKVLPYQSGSQPKFVLLLDSEFEHWPQEVSPLVKVSSFLDEHGEGRVLARTQGEFSWRLARQIREE